MRDHIFENEEGNMIEVRVDEKKIVMMNNGKGIIIKLNEKQKNTNQKLFLLFSILLQIMMIQLKDTQEGKMV